MFLYQHIVVTGTTSSGKSTLAEKLAAKIHGSFIDLDALHWEPNWIETPDDVFRERVRKAIQAPAWVVAGNYHVVRDLIWSQAEVIIWLDYSLPRIFWQLTRRTFSAGGGMNFYGVRITKAWQPISNFGHKSRYIIGYLKLTGEENVKPHGCWHNQNIIT